MIPGDKSLAQAEYHSERNLVAFEDRESAARLLADAKKGKIDEVQVHSIDRLGRDAINVL